MSHTNNSPENSYDVKFLHQRSFSRLKPLSSDATTRRLPTLTNGKPLETRDGITPHFSRTSRNPSLLSLQRRGQTRKSSTRSTVGGAQVRSKSAIHSSLLFLRPSSRRLAPLGLRFGMISIQITKGRERWEFRGPKRSFRKAVSCPLP